MLKLDNPKPRLMNTPRSLDIEVTTACNLRCSYCSHFESAGDVSGDLPLEDWLKFFEELKECAVTNLTLTGGEAFFRKDFKELIQGIVENKMRYNILSNGTLITEDIAEFMAQTRRCDSVQVSIDGSEPFTHDVFRGKGSFAKAIQGVKILQKYGIKVLVRVTIHKKNVYDLDKIAKFLLEDMGLKSFSCNSASFLGMCQKNTEMLQLDARDRSFAMQKLMDLNEKYGGKISASAGPLADAKSFMAMEKAYQENLGKQGACGGLSSCGKQETGMAVNADGSIVLCHQMSHVQLGKINKDAIKDIWHNNPDLHKMRDRRNISLDNFEYCQTCDYKNYCRGGCPALAYTITGNLYGPSPDSCYRKFKEEGGWLPETKMAAV